MWKKLIRYLLSDPRDHIMSIFLGLLCIEVFLFGPLVRAEGSMVAILNGVVFSLLLIMGVLAMTPTHIITQVASTSIIAMAIALRWMANISGSSTLYLWDKLSSLAAALTFLVLVFWQVYRESPVTVHKIRGAIAAYLLMAVVFAFLYSIIELVLPGAFTLAQSSGNLPYSQVEPFLYFSVSTLTTVGFGDITAVHPIARSLVMMESIIGILYPPVLIGILVSLHIEWLRERSGKRG